MSYVFGNDDPSNTTTDDDTLVLSVGIFPDKRDGQALFLRRKNQKITDKTKSRFQDFEWEREISSENEKSTTTVVVHGSSHRFESSQKTYYIAKHNNHYEFRADPLYNVFSSISENFWYQLTEFTYQQLKDIIDKATLDNDCFIHKTYSYEIPIYCQT
jgi:hypothetical protein